MWMTIQSLRNCLGVEELDSAMASRIIRETQGAESIKENASEKAFPEI